MSGGNANSTIAAATRVYQQYSGIRLIRIPGGRHLSTPTISSTAAATADTSMNENPSSQMSAPMSGWYADVSGGYMNHPPRGAASKKIDPHKNNPPMTNAQKPNADSRGKGRSRAPSISGMIRMARASKTGIAKRNIITEPCTVKIWLYISADRKSLFGTANCTRIRSASTPPNRKNANVTAVYQMPTCALFTDDQ